MTRSILLDEWSWLHVVGNPVRRNQSRCKARLGFCVTHREKCSWVGIAAHEYFLPKWHLFKTYFKKQFWPNYLWDGRWFRWFKLWWKDQGSGGEAQVKGRLLSNLLISPQSKGSLVRMMSEPGYTWVPGYLLGMVESGSGAGEQRGIQLPSRHPGWLSW